MLTSGNLIHFCTTGSFYRSSQEKLFKNAELDCTVVKKSVLVPVSVGDQMIFPKVSLINFTISKNFLCIFAKNETKHFDVEITKIRKLKCSSQP